MKLKKKKRHIWKSQQFQVAINYSKFLYLLQTDNTQLEDQHRSMGRTVLKYSLVTATIQVPIAIKTVAH